MDGAERADPAADDPAEEKRHDDRERGPAEGGKHGPRGDGRRDGEQGVEMEEDFDVADIVLSGEMRPEQEI